jgi:hypothetical protein
MGIISHSVSILCRQNYHSAVSPFENTNWINAKLQLSQDRLNLGIEIDKKCFDQL